MASDAGLFLTKQEVAHQARFVLQQDRIVACNQGAAGLFGCRREELLGQSLLAFSAPQQANGRSSADSLRRKVAAAMSEHRQTFEWLCLRRNGELFLTEATLAPLTSDGKRFAEMILVAMPDYQRPETSLRQFEQALERAGDAVFTTNADGIITYANAAFERLYGYGRDEVIGKTPRILSSGLVPPEVYADFWEKLLNHKVVTLEFVNRDKDDRLVYVEGTYSPIFDKEDSLIGFLSVQRDISARKQAEETLRRNQAALEEQVELRTVELTEANTAMRQQFEELALTKEELEKRNQILQVVNDLTHQALSTFDLQVIFGQVIETTGRLIDATSAYVSVIEEKGDGSLATVAADYHGPEASEAERASQLGAAFSPRARFGKGLGPDDQDQPFVIHIDDLDAPADLVAYMGQFGCQSILVVPILVKGRPVVLLEFWDSRRKRAFTADEIGLVEAIALQLAIPIENARLYAQARRELAERRLLEQQIAESLERRSRQLRLTTQVAKDVIAATDLLDLYERVVAQVKEQFGFYHVQLLRYDPEAEALILIAGNEPIGGRMVAEGHRLPLGSGLIGAAAATGQPVLRTVVAGDPQWQPNPLLPETRGELAVPIKLGDEVLGVLDIQSSVAGDLDEDDQLVMEGLCGQIAIAIESTRLRQEMVDRLRELNELQRIMSREGWDAYRAQKADQVRGYRYLEASVKAVADPEEMSAVEEGGGYVRPDGAVVATPMTIRGELIGTLGVEDDPDQPLSPEDRELLESISIQVAEALESARLLSQIQKHAIEMEAVAQVSTAASTILEAQELLNTVARLTADRFALSQVAVYLLDEGDLNRAAGNLAQPDPAELSQLRLDDRFAPVARAARSRKPVLIQDSASGGKRVAQTLAAATRSALAIPLVVGDELLGVLDLQSDTPNRFSEDDVRIHTTLAAQVAVALQNAQLYARQLETAKRLQEVDQLKSEFLASMSHELRTPLNSIIGFADVLLEGIDGDLNDRMREDVSLIRDSGRHLRMLIGEMLDMSKIEAGLMELHYEPIDVPALAREIIASTRSLAGEKDLAIDLELDPDLETVEADRTRLTQVLLNLLGNAVKFTKQGSVTLKIQQQNGDLLVSVQDTGIGIRQEDIPLIFEQFRQIDGSLTREAGGTGLGIPISRSLVELHGGEMWVESQPNIGSTFSFTIPRQRPEGVPPTVTTARSRLTGPKKGDTGRLRQTNRRS